ncbi:MAG: cysteine--tRNA ligase [Candidatus Shikimatogenerans bostrichidophilus]|nr:MAG: cysteine--tRNA ligase [Candidatus Shikimatogenerans bostrichidophilus]
MKEIIYKYKKKINIFNTLKNKKELFIPINNNIINMYVCGPTIYKNIHLGNCRTFILFDIIYRYFIHLKYNIRYIRNITDYNFKLNNNFYNNNYLYLYKIKKYYLKYYKILKLFNILEPNLEPRVTNYIMDQINNIKNLIKLKYAYIRNKSVYFDIYKYNNNKNFIKFGKILNNLNIIYNKNKLNKYLKNKIYDFSIWKNINNYDIFKWKTKWGTGIPGWHIGCTTISNKLLGDYFDIHGGGIDLKFPHHECEIIQSNIINNNNNNLAKYWIHTNMLTINNKKMSKSLNNFILPYDIIKGRYKITDNVDINPFIIRFYLIQTHYRNKLNFSYKNLKNTINKYFNLLNIFNKFKRIIPKNNTSSYINIVSIYDKCYNSINDDFNIPLLIFNLNRINNIIDKCINNILQISKDDLNKLKKILKYFLIDILGLKKIKGKKQTNIKIVINNLLKLRNEMRIKKDYEYSDRIRDIISKYIMINDK